jgi:hypothetical protein
MTEVKQEKLNATFVNFRVSEPTTEAGKRNSVVLTEGQSFEGKYIRIKSEEGFSDQIWLLEEKADGSKVINTINAGASIKKGLIKHNVQLQDTIKITFLKVLPSEKKGRRPYQVFAVAKVGPSEEV